MENINDLSALLTGATVLLPVIIGLTEGVKRVFPRLDTRWLPVVSLVFGLLGSFMLPGATWQVTTITGIVVALMASGLYDVGTKTSSVVKEAVE